MAQRETKAASIVCPMCYVEVPLPEDERAGEQIM